MLNAADLSEENEKLAWTMCVSLNYTLIKETVKKEVFSDVSSLEHQNVPVVKEEVETMNFSHYKDFNKIIS